MHHKVPSNKSAVWTHASVSSWKYPHDYTPKKHPHYYYPKKKTVVVRTCPLFTFHFGHSGYTLRFTKFHGYGHWHWCYVRKRPIFFSRPVVVYPTWIYPMWYSPRTVTYVRHITVPETTTVVREVPRDPCPYSYSEAWGLLAAGESAALSAFACLSQEYPYDGLASIGYAIANGLAGVDRSAVVAMRHAAAVDPESFRYVPSDEQIDAVLLHLHDVFAEKAADPAWRTDGLFMTAALRASLGDHGGAHFAVSQAIEQGDTDASAFALRDMLAEMLRGQLYGH